VFVDVRQRVYKILKGFAEADEQCLAGFHVVVKNSCALGRLSIACHDEYNFHVVVHDSFNTLFFETVRGRYLITKEAKCYLVELKLSRAL